MISPPQSKHTIALTDCTRSEQLTRQDDQKQSQFPKEPEASLKLHISEWCVTLYGLGMCGMKTAHNNELVSYISCFLFFNFGWFFVRFCCVALLFCYLFWAFFTLSLYTWLVPCCPFLFVCHHPYCCGPCLSSLANTSQHLFCKTVFLLTIRPNSTTGQKLSPATTATEIDTNTTNTLQLGFVSQSFHSSMNVIFLCQTLLQYVSSKNGSVLCQHFSKNYSPSFFSLFHPVHNLWSYVTLPCLPSFPSFFTIVKWQFYNKIKWSTSISTTNGILNKIFPSLVQEAH